jgi:ubiquitin carboxyl-terminal hydrolase 44/49
VQQGDPLGPLLFSLVLHRIVTKISSRAKCANLLLNLWYMDDGIIAGPAPDVRKALKLIVKYGPDLGLDLNLAKCELFCSSVETLELNDFPIQRAKNDGNIPVSAHFNFIVLGSPIGSPEFCEGWMSAATSKAELLFDRLSELNDPHTAALLLSSCCSFGKFVHVIRTVPLSHARNGLARFDNRVLQCFSDLVGDVLSPTAKLQAKLGRSRGGFGIRSLVRHANAAFVPSFCHALPDSGDNASLRLAAEELRRELRPDLNSTLCFIEECGRMPQVQFSALLEDCDLTSLAASFYNSFADLARLNSVCAPHSSTWLEMPPSKGLGLHLNPPQARAIFKLRLGLQLFDKSMFCDKCDLKLLDPHGHHALTCKCMGSRHNRVADVLFDFLRLGQFRPSKEMGACANDLERPADILVPGLAQNGSQDLAVDVTVVSALSQSALVESALTLDGSGAVHLAELKKHEENDAKCLRLGWECLAFAMDTHGRFGDESAPFLRTLASRVGAQSGVSFASALRSIRGKLGVTLMRANGDAIIAARPLPSIDGKLIGPVDIHRMGSVADVQWEPRILPCSLSSLVAVSPLLPAVPRSDSVSPGRGAAQARLPSHGAPSVSLSLYPPRAVERECVLPVSVPACTPISVFSPFVPAAAAAAAAAVLGSGPLFPMSSEGAEFAGCASGTS